MLDWDGSREHNEYRYGTSNSNGVYKLKKKKFLVFLPNFVRPPYLRLGNILLFCPSFLRSVALVQYAMHSRHLPALQRDPPSPSCASLRPYGRVALFCLLSVCRSLNVANRKALVRREKKSPRVWAPAFFSRTSRTVVCGLSWGVWLSAEKIRK